jgi:hypothetical protein
MKIPKIKLLIYFLLFTVLAAIIIMITVESFGGGKIVINNKTKYAIESLEAVVVDEDTIDIGVMYDGEVGANSVVKESFDKIEIGSVEYAQVYIGVTFEDYAGKIEIIEGYITKDFKGNTDIEIFEEDGELFLKAKMGTALFGSTKDTGLDEKFILYPDEADYDYADLAGIDFEGDEEE